MPYFDSNVRYDSGARFDDLSVPLTRKNMKAKLGLILILGIILFSSGAFAMADRRVINNGDNRGDNRGDRHFYRGGRWYKHDSRGNEIAVDILAIGALIESLPPQHTTVIVQNTPYYYDNTRYYQQLPDGSLVVVPPPRR